MGHGGGAVDLGSVPKGELGIGIDTGVTMHHGGVQCGSGDWEALLDLQSIDRIAFATEARKVEGNVADVDALGRNSRVHVSPEQTGAALVALELRSQLFGVVAILYLGESLGRKQGREEENNGTRQRHENKTVFPYKEKTSFDTTKTFSASLPRPTTA